MLGALPAQGAAGPRGAVTHHVPGSLPSAMRGSLAPGGGLAGPAALEPQGFPQSGQGQSSAPSPLQAHALAWPQGTMSVALLRHRWLTQPVPGLGLCGAALAAQSPGALPAHAAGTRVTRHPLPGTRGTAARGSSPTHRQGCLHRENPPDQPTCPRRHSKTFICSGDISNHVYSS